MTAVCLSVFPHDISKTDATRFTKRDIKIFNVESWKPIISASEGQRSQVTKSIVVMGLCTLVSAGSSDFVCYIVGE